MRPNAETSSVAEPFLTVEQVAERLALSRRSVATLVALGKIPIVRVSTRAIRIDPADLRRYIDQRRSGASRGYGM